MRRFLLLLLFPSMLHAQPQFVFSPGFRVGYASGEKGGITFGVDVSLMTGSGIDGVAAGIVFQSDHSRNDGWKRTHLGAQVVTGAPGLEFPYSYGMEIGPSWITDERGTHLGLTTNVFTGLILYPSLGATLYDGKVMAESGIYVKLPIPLFQIDFSH